MNKLKEKGITLVALVITIIILLILAGVTLNSALSNHGLFNRAQTAKEKYEVAEQGETNAFNNLEWEVDDAINIMSQKIKVDELKSGEYVNYKIKDGTVIKCLVLYDKEYNEEHNTNYGIQVVPLACLQLVQYSGYANWANIVSLLNGVAETYRNEEITEAGGARCLGTDPNNPSAAGTMEDFNRINELQEKFSIEFTGAPSYWYATSRFYNSRYYEVGHLMMADDKVVYLSNAIATATGTTYHTEWETRGFIPVFRIDSKEIIK